MKTNYDNNTLTLYLEGRIDSNNASAVEGEVLAAVDNAPGASVVLDADNLEYISSAGLRVLLAMQKAMNAKQGQMRVTGANEVVMEVFEVTGFCDILNIE